jgi:hypothetical protein
MPHSLESGTGLRYSSSTDFWQETFLIVAMSMRGISSGAVLLFDVRDIGRDV